jgi:hypothetical protein
VDLLALEDSDESFEAAELNRQTAAKRHISAPKKEKEKATPKVPAKLPSKGTKKAIIEFVSDESLDLFSEAWDESL